MKRRAFWRTFFLCFTLALGLLVFAGPRKAQAANDSPVYYVYINGCYLGEGDGADGLYYVGTSETDGYVTKDSSADWNARYIPSSGRLILRNYRGGKIVCLPAHTMQNFDIQLQGNSFITETSSNGSYGVGIQISSPNVKTVITSAEQEHGTLTINVYNTSVPCYGINCCVSGTGSEGVYVQGTANVMITAAGRCGFGIWAGGTVGVLERASVNITAKYNKNASNDFSAAVYSKTGNLDISTTGGVSIESVARDEHKHSGYGFAFYSDSNSGCLNCSPKDFPYVSLSAVGYHAKVSNRTSVMDSTYYNLEKTTKQTGITEGLLLQFTNTEQLPIVGAIFPDPSFRSYVRNKYDGNSDGILSDSERLYIKTITIEDDADSRLYNDAYSLVGIERFENLIRLIWDPDASEQGAARGNLIELDLRSNKELKSVTVRNTRLRELYVSYLSKLTWLDCTDNFLHGPTLSGLTSLTDLLMYDNLLTNINVSAIPNLSYLDVGENRLETLDVSWNTNLRFLYCQNNKLESLDVTNLTALEQLTCSGNLFTTLDLSQNTALEWLSCNNSCLTSLDVSKNTELYALDCSHSDSLKSMTLGTNGNLARLRLFDSANLVAVNISSCKNLKNAVLNGTRKDLTEDGCDFVQYGIYDETDYAVNCVDADLGTVLIYKKPGTVYAAAGDEKTLSIRIVGNGTVCFRWQYRTSSSDSWKNCDSSMTGYNKKDLKITATLDKNGYQYRCRVKNLNGTYGYGPVSTLHVIGIKTQPKGVSAYVGQSATFSVKAVGSNLTYTWQFSKDSGKTWTGWGEGSSLKIAVKDYRNGYRFRCVITEPHGVTVTSSAAKLTVKPKIVTQPTAKSAYVGATAKFTVEATGAGLKYRWQVSKDSGSTWKDVTSANEGYNKATLKLVVKADWNGYRYRCHITDANGKTLDSSGVKLTVKPKITKQPSAASAAVGATAKFSVTATGAGLKYRWQVSKDGGSTWKNVTSANEGYNKATLKLVVKAEWNGYRYRCVVTDANGATVTSSDAKLTVN
nr:leucine-rich repeat domain-containing protein [Lachnospiraceae bacterium]